MGGVWEGVIRSVRKVIRCLTKEQLVSGEALRTLMTEIECILNGRPLTPSSDSPGDLEALTPNHLLLFRPNNTICHQAFSLKMTCIVDADGDRSSIYRTYFGNDGYQNTYLLFRSVKSGLNQGAILPMEIWF